jgi:hypothetical protein
MAEDYDPDLPSNGCILSDNLSVSIQGKFIHKKQLNIYSTILGFLEWNFKGRRPHWHCGRCLQ